MKKLAQNIVFIANFETTLSTLKKIQKKNSSLENKFTKNSFYQIETKNVKGQIS